MNSLRNNKIVKFLIIGGFCAMLCFVVLGAGRVALAEGPSIFSAEGLTNVISNAVLAPMSIPINALFLGIPYLVGMFGGLFITVFSLVLHWMFLLNTNVLPDRFEMIETGFQICLSIANLMFVVALIAIAFATILNVQEYNAKKMLGKVIVAAVAVNFSYLIVGLMLDASHIVTNYFISGGGLANIGDSFGIILQPQKFLATPNIANLSTAIFSGPWFKMILGALSGALFTWIMAIVVISFAMMFLARYVTLVFLIILMPLAWAAPLFPKMSEAGHQWWSKFIEQLIFLPAATFFVYLSMKMAITLRGVGTTAGSNISGNTTDAWINSLKPWEQGWGTTFAGGTGSLAELALSPQLVVETLLPCAFLIASLIVAQKLGGSTASFGVKWGTKTAQKLMGGIGRYALRSKAVGSLAGKGFNAINSVARAGPLKIYNKIPVLGKLPTAPENQSLEQMAKGAVGSAGGKLHKGILYKKDGSVRGGLIREVARETGITGLAYGAKGYGASVDGYYKDFKEGYDHDELHEVTHHLPESDGEKAGLLKLMVEEGKVKEFADDSSKDAEKDKILALRDARIATSGGKLNDAKERAKDKELKALAAFRPDLAPDILGVDTIEFTKTQMDSKDFQNISKHVVDDPKFTENLSASERAAVARTSREHEEKIVEKTTNELTAKLDETGIILLHNLGVGLTKIQGEIATLRTQKDSAKQSLQTALLTGADADTAKNELRIVAEKLAAKTKERDEKLEEIKNNEDAKKNAGVKNMISILERIERNTGSIAARDRAEEKHGHKDTSLKGVFKWVSEAAGGGGGGGGGHGGGHH